MLPPDGRTHLHGRWVLTQQSKRPIWIDYTPADLTDVLRLPPNLPMNDAHWRDRILPGFDFKIHSYKDVLNFIAVHQTKIGLEYNPMNPHKPIASKVRLPGENQVITYYPPDEQQ